MSSPATILCIDDDLETLSLRKQLLETHGYSVVTAQSGAEGLQRFSEAQTVDLVLLDYAMPGGLTGEQVAREMKLRHPAVPIVIMSAFPDLPDTLLRMVDGCVPKGQDPEIVIQAVSTALAPRRSEL